MHRNHLDLCYVTPLAPGDVSIGTTSHTPEVIRFWNQLVGLPEGNIWRDIMLDNIAGQDCRKNWSGQVKAFLSGIGYSSGALQLEKIDGD